MVSSAPWGAPGGRDYLAVANRPAPTPTLLRFLATRKSALSPSGKDVGSGSFREFVGDPIFREQANKEIIMQVTPTRDRLVSISTLVAMLDRSRASIYRDIQANVFPKPLKLGGSSRWLLCEVEDHIAKLSKNRLGGQQLPLNAESE